MKAKVGECISLFRLYHKLGGLFNKHLLTHSSGSYKSENKVLAEQAFPEGCEGGSVHASL